MISNALFVSDLRGWDQLWRKIIIIFFLLGKTKPPSANGLNIIFLTRFTEIYQISDSYSEHSSMLTRCICITLFEVGIQRLYITTPLSLSTEAKNKLIILLGPKLPL